MAGWFPAVVPGECGGFGRVVWYVWYVWYGGVFTMVLVLHAATTGATVRSLVRLANQGQKNTYKATRLQGYQADIRIGEQPHSH